MSSQSIIGDAGSISGHKRNFSQTCNLLSQFIKKKRSFGDLSLAIDSSNNDGKGTTEGFTPTTMNLFPVNNSQVEEVAKQDSINSNTTQVSGTIEQYSPFSPPNKYRKSSSMETEKAQMTIFYGGRVFVFNDLPPQKAKEIMEVASRGCSMNLFPTTPVSGSGSGSSSADGSVFKTMDDSTTVQKFVSPLNSCPPVSPAISHNFGNKSTVQQRSLTPATVSDLPIARRASLHRFLEKRKDRITASAPYNSTNSGEGSAKPVDQNRSWLGLDCV